MERRLLVSKARPRSWRTCIKQDRTRPKKDSVGSRHDAIGAAMCSRIQARIPSGIARRGSRLSADLRFSPRRIKVANARNERVMSPVRSRSRRVMRASQVSHQRHRALRVMRLGHHQRPAAIRPRTSNCPADNFRSLCVEVGTSTTQDAYSAQSNRLRHSRRCHD